VFPNDRDQSSAGDTAGVLPSTKALGRPAAQRRTRNSRLEAIDLAKTALR